MSILFSSDHAISGVGSGSLTSPRPVVNVCSLDRLSRYLMAGMTFITAHLVEQIRDFRHVRYRIRSLILRRMPVFGKFSRVTCVTWWQTEWPGKTKNKILSFSRGFQQFICPSGVVFFERRIAGL